MPRQLPERRRGGAYSLIIVGIIVAGVALVLMSSLSGGQYAVEIGQVVAAEPDRYEGKRLRVVGNIKADSARHVVVEGKPELHFAIVDAHGNELAVVYPQAPPDAFEDGRECIVEGTLTSPTTIEAAKLTVKCPSKYQTEDGLVDKSPEYYRDKYGAPPPTSGPG